VASVSAALSLPRRPDLSGPALAGLALLLCILIGVPVFWLGYFSLTDKSGALTLANFIEVATDESFVDPLLTTLGIAVSVAIGSCIVALPVGWLVARTDMPFQRTVRALIMASFVTPPFLGAIAWEILAAPNSGILNRIYRDLTGAEMDSHLFNVYSVAGLAAAAALPLLFVTILLLRAQRTILGRRGYAVVGGKYGEPRRLALGPWRWVALAFCLFVLCFPVFLPYAALFKAAFTRVPSEPLSFATLTWHHVNFVFFEFSQTKVGLRNTLVLGAASATIGTVLAFVIAYLTTRQAIVGHRILGFLATAPVAIPGIVLGVGLFLAYTRPPLVLYGTLWILLLAYLTVELPAAYQQLQSAFKAVHPELEEASRILGATRLQAMRHVTAPLLRSGVIAAWCFIFIGVMRELSAAIMLFTANTKVISVVIYDLNESGDLGAISVLGLSMLAITFAVVVLVNRLPRAGSARLQAS
jgi:ABC-type Fe3+ transport system permease subunit